MIAYRMIARLSFRALLTTLSLVVLLVLLADFIESAGKLDDSSGFWNVLLLYLCKIPSITYLALPVAFVVGTCLVFAAMGRHGELRGLAASGLAPLDLFKPVFVSGLGLAVFVFLLGEILVPRAYDKIEQLMQQHFGRIDSSWRFFTNHQWTKGDSGRLIRVGHKSKDGRNLDYVICLTMDKDFHIIRRLDARRVQRREHEWVAQRVEIRRFHDSKQLSYEKKASTVLRWTEKPERFRDFSGRPQQKNIIQLLSTISMLNTKGIDSSEYSLELHRRFTYPFLGILLVFLLFPWLSDPLVSRSASAAVVQASSVVFAGYLVVVFCTTAVSGGLLSPVLGAWLAPALFLFAGAAGWISQRSKTADRGIV